MTREEVINMLKAKRDCTKRETSGMDEMCNNGRCVDCPLNYEQGNMGEQKEALDMAIKALEQEPCDDVIGRAEAMTEIMMFAGNVKSYEENIYIKVSDAVQLLRELPPVTPKPKTGYCKDCKYFEYNSVAKVDGIPLIVAHEICKKWGDGCKTNENGYCFLFASQESEGNK